MLGADLRMLKVPEMGKAGNKKPNATVLWSSLLFPHTWALCPSWLLRHPRIMHVACQSLPAICSVLTLISSHLYFLTCKNGSQNICLRELEGLN